MEERKLNFNAPLLSVRRYSATPVASSDGRNGKRIENSKPKRQYTIPFYKSDCNMEQVTEPVAVPFLWEQIPGRAKDGRSKHQNSEEANSSPTLSSRMALDIIKYPLRKEPESRPRIELRLANGNEADDEKWNSDLDNDDDDAYSDALDTLSPTESFSINCSVTGLSECDGQVLKPSGTFSTDPQTRDFMMSRFLPAAKAMALEPPQYASKKQHLATEQPREVKVVSEERRPIINKSIVIPQYDEDVDEEESEDEGDNYDDSGNLTNKACGLLPMLCFNKSLSLLKPVPGLKVRTHSSVSSTSGATCVESHSPSMKKHNSNNTSKRLSDGEVCSPKLTRMENKTTFASNRLMSLTDQQTTNRSSPFRRGISPYRNERHPSPFRGGGFLGMPKEPENLKENRSNMYKKASSKSHELIPLHSLRKESGSRSPTVEKTLYVDTVNFAKVSPSNSFSSDIKNSMGSLKISSAAPSSLQKENRINAKMGRSITGPHISGPLEKNASSLSEAVGLDQECKSLESIEITANEKSSEKNLVVVHQGYDNNGGSEQSPLPPPLPKTPSESWLWRTLPSVPSRNSFSHSRGIRQLSRKQDPKSHLSNTKWETIVKSSYIHHDHVRYSEELSSHSPQQSKT